MVECLVANENVRSSTLLSCSTKFMYKIYWTNDLGSACSTEIVQLQSALIYCDLLRKQGMQYVTMVSDYADMVGKPGARGAGTEYVPQMLN